jgi:hypothetical protein
MSAWPVPPEAATRKPVGLPDAVLFTRVTIVISPAALEATTPYEPLFAKLLLLADAVDL